LRLTPSAPSAGGTLKIVAPGYNRHQYTTQRIDTTAFGSGTVEIEVSVAAASATDASFDLFPQNATVPSEGYPTTSVAQAYDVARGQSSRLTYRFTKGEIFTFGAQGNWFSQAGNEGTVQYRVPAGEVDRDRA
jgi:hypothetical protein